MKPRFLLVPVQEPVVARVNVPLNAPTLRLVRNESDGPTFLIEASGASLELHFPDDASLAEFARRVDAMIVKEGDNHE